MRNVRFRRNRVVPIQRGERLLPTPRRPRRRVPSVRFYPLAGFANYQCPGLLRRSWRRRPKPFQNRVRFARGSAQKSWPSCVVPEISPYGAVQ